MSRVVPVSTEKATRSRPSHHRSMRASSAQLSPKRLPKFERQWRMQLEDSVTAIAWSSDSTTLAATSAAGEIVWGPPNHPPHLLDQRPEAMSCIAFSGSDRFLAASGQSGHVIVWSLDPSAPAIIFSRALTKDWIDCLAWHPTALLLAIGVGANVHLWDMTTQTLVTKFAFQRSSVLALAWHPDGTHLAVSGHGGVSVWSVTHGDSTDWTPASWTKEPEFIDVPGASIAAQWSSDGRYLGSGNLDRTLTLVDWGNPPPWFMQGFPGKVRQLSWSNAPTSSGSPLLAAACTTGITIWERESKQEGLWRSRVLEQHTETVRAIAFHPHTFTLASAAQDGKLVLWHNAKTVAQTLKGAEQGWSAIGWSPDGKALVAGGQGGELRLWAPSSRGQGFQ